VLWKPKKPRGNQRAANAERVEKRKGIEKTDTKADYCYRKHRYKRLGEVPADGGHKHGLNVRSFTAGQKVRDNSTN